MATSYVDFNDLFRLLAEVDFVSEKLNNNKMVENILDICANSVFLRKKDIPKYSPSQIKQLKEILEK